MGQEIKVPQMGESISEATVGAIFKESGSPVKMDEEILELETDKVNQVLYAPAAGTLQLSIQVDDVVKIGQAIGSVEGGKSGDSKAQNSEDSEKKTKENEESEGSKESDSPKKSDEKAKIPEGSGGVRQTREAFVEGLSAPKAEATPTAPATSTPRAASQSSAPTVATPAGGETETRQRMPKIRQVIAERLLEAQSTTAMLTTFNEADLSKLMALRNQYKDAFLKKHEVKLGFMSFFVKAVVSGLKEFPALNSYIDGTDMVHREYFHIGIAVGTEKGLMVPVLRNCETMSLAEIEKGIASYAKRAREGGIAVPDLQGGGFTITNGGIYGSLLSTPILNPPQAGILGMHKIQKRAVVVNDEVVVRPMMYLALSYDHRIVDGQGAVGFLVHVKECLEDPSRMLLEL